MAPPAKVVEGANSLAKRDRVLRGALKSFGPPDLRRGRPKRSHFAELARMICYQQLAGRAAAAIHARFDALFDGEPTPDAVFALPVETLRGAGLSGSKAASIVDLAESADDQGWCNDPGISQESYNGETVDAGKHAVYRHHCIVGGMPKAQSIVAVERQIGAISVRPQEIQ